MTREFTLGKEERLKSNLSIQELLKHGSVESRYPLKIYWDFSPDPHQKYPARAAISVPKRKFRRAVDRNLMKRRLREAYRLNKNMLYEILDQHQQKIQLIILLLSDEFIPYDQLEKGMYEILRQLVNKLS
jgi:ribonuclease P protein component